MTTPTAPTKPGVLKPASSSQPVRVIKAAQAGKLLGQSGRVAGQGLHALPSPAHQPEIRLIHAGADYCDLEITCGCGENTKVRCWTTPAASATTAKVA